MGNRTSFRPDIQGLRALSLGLILLFHAGLPVSGGYVGVDVFFVISGFVITQMLIREHAKQGRIDIRAFFVRRFRRLTPALSVTVTFTMLIAILLQSPFGAQQQTVWTGLASLAFGANVVIAGTTGGYFDAPSEGNPLLNLWSLSVEEQVYLVVPFLMAGGWVLARRLGPRSVPAVIALFGALSLSIAIVTAGATLSWPATAIVGYYGALGRAWEFSAGALLGWVLASRGPIRRWMGESLAWLGLGLILWAGFTFTGATPFPGPATLVPVLGASALIAAGQAPGTSISRFMAWRPVAAAGDLSYAWYLWHWPLVVFALILLPRHPIAGASAAVMLSVVPAFLSTRFIERPIRERRWLAGRTGLLAAITYAVPLTVGLLVLAGADRGWGLDWPRTYRYTESLSYSCHDAGIDWERCAFTSAGTSPRGTVALIGDSQALSLSDGVVAAATDLGLRTIVSSRSECPVLPAGTVRWVYDNSACEEWQGAIVDAVIAARPDVVMIAQRPYFEGRTDNVDLLSPAGEVLEGEPSVDAYASSLGSALARFRAAGIAIVLVDPIPEAAYDMPPQGIIGRQEERIDAIEARARANSPARVNRELAEALGAVRVDPLSVLCDRSTCPETKDGDALYADARHLSPPGALLLREQLALALGQALRER